MEDIGQHDKESLASWTILTAPTKRKVMVLMNFIPKFGYDSNKDMSEMIRELHTINKRSDCSAVETRTSPRKRKPKWRTKEVPQFDGDPKKQVKWIKSTDAIMG